MIATIPYTDNPEEAIQYLRKYGHDLKLYLQSEKSVYWKFKSMHFNCLICEARIRLNRHADKYKDKWRVIVNDDGVENANYYCEKYRALY